MSDCSCNGTATIVYHSRCYTCADCNGCSMVSAMDPSSNQKIIQKQVRVPASLYLMNLAALNVTGPSSNKASLNSLKVNWNQASDRRLAHMPTQIVPSRGNSLQTSITRLRPGSLAPGGSGVDVKHNSYDRYLARLKSQNIKRETTQSLPAKYGNKTMKFGLAYSKSCSC